MPGNLILLRHGASSWNEQGLFTGWCDVPLSPKGWDQAKRAARMLVNAKLLPDAIHTSLLARAISTAESISRETDRRFVIPAKTWRLNERHYGALQGRSKREVVAEFGEEQFTLWRRSFEEIPPPVLQVDAYSRPGDPTPTSESLRQVLERTLVYWEAAILPQLVSGRNVLVVSHSNTLRALIMHLDDVDRGDIAAINVPTGIPLVYRFGPNGQVAQAGIYLDQVAARRGAAAVAKEGMTN